MFIKQWNKLKENIADHFQVCAVKHKWAAFLFKSLTDQLISKKDGYCLGYCIASYQPSQRARYALNRAQGASLTILATAMAEASATSDYFYDDDDWTTKTSRRVSLQSKKYTKRLNGKISDENGSTSTYY
jgi:hypothetical protein